MTTIEEASKFQHLHLIATQVLAQSILNKLSSEWDDCFVCHDYSMVGRQKVNSIVSNCYLKNLARDVTESRKGDQVREFTIIINSSR